MTATTAVSLNGHRPTPEELRAAARDAYRASLGAEAPLSGAALGRRFEMSDRWGRDRVAEVQRNDTPNNHPREPGREIESAGRDEPATSREEAPTTRDQPATAAPGPVPVVVEDKTLDAMTTDN
jgi:hypothetical protein